MKFHKRQIILASLVIALGTAVYLNWQFSDSKSIPSTNILESAKEFGEAKYVNSTKMADKSEPPTSTEPNSKKYYFAQAQSNRQKAREDAEEKLKSLSSEQNLSDEIKEEIKKQIENLSKNVQQEASIENLIKAKGFGDCIVSIQNGECSVIVSPESLNESSVIIIRDIVTGKSGIPADKIKIIEAK